MSDRLPQREVRAESLSSLLLGIPRARGAVLMELTAELLRESGLPAIRLQRTVSTGQLVSLAVDCGRHSLRAEYQPRGDRFRLFVSLPAGSGPVNRHPRDEAELREAMEVVLQGLAVARLKKAAGR